VKKERTLETIIQDIVLALNQEDDSSYYAYKSYSNGWILEINKLSKQQATARTMHIWGYTFPLNTAAVAAICTDKTACATILKTHQIPCVSHQLFIRPSLTNYTPTSGIFRPLLQHAEGIGYPLVAKIKDGTGGTGVFYISTSRELEIAAMSCFTKGKDICLSPYYDIAEEYRMVMLDGKLQVCFSKERPALIGDGQSPIATLLTQCFSQKKWNLSDILIEGQGLHRPITDVLLPGEVVHLNWKHNLGSGSIPQIVQPLQELLDLAIQAAQTIGLRFGSVDIIQAKQDHMPYRILEINAGVMLDNFVAHYKKDQLGYQKAFDIYKQAICSYFKE
jgi:glutathione synthase/RimK-type ligase-like ATP-grasp enzyme